jgi:NodT family efflux transporter outer membrane factor (OMF) lipoprotein
MKKLALICLLLLVGCQKEPIKIRHQPDIETPDQWTSADVDNSEIILDWWTSFEDSALDVLVARGLQKNYNLRAAAARLDSAAAQARIAGAGQLPSIAAGWSGRGQRQNFIGFPIPGSEDRVLSRTSKSSGVSLDVSWEADVWGRISAGKIAALADYNSAEADVRAAKLSLAGQLSKAWFASIENLEQVRLAERTVESYADTSERVRSRYVRGLQSSLDVRLALSSLSSAQALLEQRKRQLDLSTRQIEILLGEYPKALLAIGDSLPEPPPPPPTGVPSELVARRPDLVSAEQRMWAAGARWSQARLALYPSFNITGGIGTSTSGFLEVLNGNFFVWNLAGNALQPIFQGGRLRAQVELEDARAKEAAAVWVNAVLSAFSEVESALAAEKFLLDQRSMLQEAAQQALASAELAEDRYNSGLENFVTVLESQRRSLDTESQLLTIQRQVLDSRVDLHLALGGSF